MASVRNEAPKAAKGVGCGERVCPPQKMLYIFELKMARFGAFWELILLQFELPVLYA